MPVSPCVPRRTRHRADGPRSAARGFARIIAIAMACQLTLAGAVRAQGLVAGYVTDKASHQPIAGAQLFVQGTTLGALTDASGHFRIRGAEGTTVNLIARRIGYASETKTVTVGDTAVQFALEPRATSLDEVVVTATAGASTKREIGNAVTTIDATRIQQVAPIQSFQELLNGRAPNVDVIEGSGQVGTGAKIRVRGISSFDLTQTPLIYVDGVRIDNDQATGPVNQAFGSSSISRWNDIDPEEIAKVEVIRGPSAATLYGTEASNGVIQIVTKQGATGPARYEFSVTQGTNFVMNPQGRWPTNWNTVNGQLQSINFTQLNDAYKQHTGNDIFQNGYTRKYRAGVGGGSDLFQYYVSATSERDDGAEQTNDLHRENFRANLTVQPSDKFKIETHMGYQTGRTNLAPEAGYGGIPWTTMLMDPASVSDPGAYGFGSSLPWQYNEEYHMFQDINRFTGSIQFTHQPTSWFTQRLILGADQVNTMDVELALRIDSLIATGIGTDALGYKFQSNNTDGFRTYDYAATAKFGMSDFNFATSVGAQYYTKKYEFVSAGGFVFPAQGLTSINALTTGLGTGQDVTENNTLGYYAQETIGWKDRRYLTLALRTDKNSAFGTNFKRAYYPKASLSWVVSDEPFFHVNWLNSLRLRAAYGETGQQPDQFSALRTYAPVTGPGDQPGITALTLGNSKLGPERGKEFETGFESSFLDDRVGLEFTYYNKNTDNAILDQQVAPSVGFGSDMLVNAGHIKNSGEELVLNVTPVRRDNFQWDAAVAFSHNTNKIISLGIPGVTSISPGTYQEDINGFPVGAWFLKKVVSAKVDNTGTAYDIMCDDGHGGQVDCSVAPKVFQGSSVPTKEGAFTSTFTLWKRLKLYGTVNYQLNFQKLDGNLRIRCYFQIGGMCKDLADPVHGNPVIVAGAQEGIPSYLISNAGFFRLGEVSASYLLSEDMAAKLHARTASLTVAGRNLATWTGYKGLDPTAQFLGGSRGTSVAWEQTVTPTLSSFLLTLNLTF
ncbi:MAG TPA: SusC/RagA family TonB-linked outer membrane protein [Gemmatimonadaceae bacterium]|nr:SusC/RagA family TonB-linked outer membrane protein [Gemmatimonadaceae bacterium]